MTACSTVEIIESLKPVIAGCLVLIGAVGFMWFTWIFIRVS